jgi:hypothetical protein
MIEHNESEPLWQALTAGLDAIEEALSRARSTGPCGPEPVGAREAPDPEWVRGTCPACGAALVSNSYYIGGKGYILVWECWERLGPSPSCDYRRVL